MLELVEQLDVEKIALSCLINESELLNECQLYPEHFSIEKHQNLMKLLMQMSNKNEPIDLISVSTKALNKISKLGGLSYLNEIANAAPSASQFLYYQSLVLEQFNKRQLIDIANEILERAENKEDFASIAAVLERSNDLNNVTDDNGDITNELSTYIDSFYIPRTECSIKTGFKDRDRLIGGYKETQFIVIGARPSIGKTAYALNELKNIIFANKNNVVVFFSCETKKRKILDRLTCMIGNIDSNKMNDPAKLFDEQDFQRAMVAALKLNEVAERLKIYDKITDIDQIRRECRQLRRKYPDKNLIAYIDYLQLLTYDHAPKNFNRTQVVGHISKSLKRTAMENDMTIVSLSQLSRDVEKRQDKRPTLADLRESGDIEQDADIVSFLYRDDYYNKNSELKDILEVITEKNRDGETGVIELKFIKKHFKFADLEEKA